MNDNSTKISFLSNAISDAQELIKFCDTKTAIVITILGSYVFAFFSNIEKLVKYSSGYSIGFWILLSLFLLLLLLCIVITTRIIKPTNNPIDNIVFGNQKNPKLKFFLAPNDYSAGGIYAFQNSSKFKLKENFEEYLKNLNIVKDEEIIQTLTLELFKVNYIRNIKNDRFNILLYLLAFTTIIFILTYLRFSFETNIIESRMNCF